MLNVYWRLYWQKRFDVLNSIDKIGYKIQPNEKSDNKYPTVFRNLKTLNPSY